MPEIKITHEDLIEAIKDGITSFLHVESATKGSLITDEIKSAIRNTINKEFESIDIEEIILNEVRESIGAAIEERRNEILDRFRGPEKEDSDYVPENNENDREFLHEDEQVETLQKSPQRKRGIVRNGKQ